MIVPNLPLLNPDAYQETGTPEFPDHPALRGGECTCGYVFFPMQNYGCQKCGRHGEALKPRLLSGRGRLWASAKVHLHMGPRKTPFTVCSVHLVDGPLIRTLLVDDKVRSSVGQFVTTTLVPIEDPESGDKFYDLRFQPETSTKLEHKT